MVAVIQQQQQQAQKSWYESAMERADTISKLWDIFLAWAGHIAQWVLFGCMISNIIQIIPALGLPTNVASIILAIQSIMLDIGGFSLNNLAAAAERKGNLEGAKKGKSTGKILIGIMILTMVLLTIKSMVHDARVKTGVDIAENVLLLARVGLTVIYLHVIHDLRDHGETNQVTAQSQAINHQQLPAPAPAPLSTPAPLQTAPGPLQTPAPAPTPGPLPFTTSATTSTATTGTGATVTTGTSATKTATKSGLKTGTSTTRKTGTGAIKNTSTSATTTTTGATREESLQAVYERLQAEGKRISGRVLAEEVKCNRKIATDWLQSQHPAPAGTIETTEDVDA